MTDPRHQLLKDFRVEWPYERIQNLTLEEYTNLNKNSLCYWLESKVNDVGSIWGGSSFKFGIYEKDQKDKMYNSGGRLSDTEYAWYSKYGKTREDAFEKVKSLLLQVLHATRNSTFNMIDQIDLGDTIKWKLAYIFSDNQILNIFSKSKLIEICNRLGLAIEKNDTFFALQNKILKTKPANQDFFAFGDRFWRDITLSNNLLKTLELLKPNVLTYFQTLDTLLDELDIQSDSEKVYFNYEKTGKLIFGVGQRYVFNLTTKGFRYISKTPISSNHEAFDGPPEAYLNKSATLDNRETILANIIESALELLPLTVKSGFLKHTKEDLKEMVFNKDFRAKVFEELNVPIDDTQPNKKMNHPLNQILFGPPGTGKTYTSIDKAVFIASGKSDIHEINKPIFDQLRKEGQIEFVTFHQGYSYEDFMVGIKPNTDTEQLTFKPHKGIFYKLVERAKANYSAYKNNQQEARTFDEIFEEIVAPLADGEVIEIEMRSGNSFKITDVENGTIRFEKPNGSDRHTLSVDTLRAVVEGRREFNSGLGVYYKPLVQLIAKYQQPVAAQTALKNYVIIIDEINRANISKVFGELITLLENDKRMDADNALSLTLPNGEPDFAIPPNIYIVGTMNTADKSIALVDIALRRRFEFEGFYPDYSLLKESFPKAAPFLQKINEAIYSRKKTADFLIGHGYFMKNESLEIIILKRVIPLLTEYFSGRTDEVREILKFANISAEFDTSTYQWNINSILSHNGIES